MREHLCLLLERKLIEAHVSLERVKWLSAFGRTELGRVNEHETLFLSRSTRHHRSVLTY